MSSGQETSAIPWSLLDWHLVCEAAWVETDRAALFSLVEAAEAAALTRRDALSSQPGHCAERLAIEEALTQLGILKAEKLRFRTPNQ